MITVKVYNDILSGDEAFFMEMCGAKNAFTLEKVKNIFAGNPKESDFTFNIHCSGGHVSEGLAIYDAIRTSGKNIFCNIDGNCHSMAVCILLAAPAENRTANPHAKSLIHKVRGGCCGTTAEEIRQYSESVKRDEEAIVNIYCERTGKSKEAMRALMSAEKERTAEELLQLGFISKINSYNTNFKNFRQMEKNQKNLFQRAANFVTKTGNKFFASANFDYADSDGNVLFSTEGEEDTLAVGSVVTLPDGETGGTFELEDGRVVTVVDSVVTEISTPDDETENLRSENADLRAGLQEALNLINDLKGQISSNYKPAVRTAKTNSAAPQSRVSEKLAAAKAAAQNKK